MVSSKSPFQLILVYQLRSRLDTCFSDKISRQTAEGEWQHPLFKPGQKVFTRNFGKGAKWLPEIIKSTEGCRMVTVQTYSELVRRHQDQVRQRRTKDPLGFHDWASTTLNAS